MVDLLLEDLLGLEQLPPPPLSAPGCVSTSLLHIQKVLVSISKSYKLFPELQIRRLEDLSADSDQLLG